MAGRVAPGNAVRMSSRVFRDEPERSPLRVPHPGRGRRWDRRAVEAWRSLTAEPFVQWWRPSDRATAVRWMHLLDRLYVLLDDPQSSPGAIKALAGEVRSLERELGASPMSRSNLRWEQVDSPRKRTSEVRTLRMADLERM
jgi:hypothetical protein